MEEKNKFFRELFAKHKANNDARKNDSAICLCKYTAKSLQQLISLPIFLREIKYEFADVIVPTVD